MTLSISGYVPLLQVFDMPKALAFYRDVLGFDVDSQSEPGDTFDWCLLRRDRMRLMLNTAYERGERPASPDAARLKAHGDTTLYFECPDPDAAYAHLRAKGVDASPPALAYYGMTQVYVTDPDGYVLCFQCPA